LQRNGECPRDGAGVGREFPSEALVRVTPAFDIARRFVGAINGGGLLAAERRAGVACAIYNVVAGFHYSITISEDGSLDQGG